MTRPQERNTWREYPPVLARHDCSFCHGTGWQMIRSPFSAGAKRCECRYLCRLLQLKEAVRIPERYQGCTLDSFVPSTPSQCRAVAAAVKYALCYPDVPRNLFLIGGPGSGKTHLAAGIVRELLARFQADLLFVDFCEIVGPAESGRRPIWKEAVEAALLVVDDFGPGNASLDRLGMTQEFLAARLRSRRHTIFTGEAFRCRELFQGKVRESSRPLEKLLASLSSRLLLGLLGNAKIIRIDAPDYRRRHCRAGSLF